MSTVPPNIDDDDDEPIAASTRSDDEEMDITPMIDITFLLLIFFVVCSKMDPSQTTNLPKADYGQAISAKDSAVIVMKRGTGEVADLETLDGVSFTKDLEAQQEALKKFLVREREAGAQRIMLMCEKDVRSGEVSRIQRMLGDAFQEEDWGQKTFVAVKEE